jgi:hypothetical protein
MNFKTVLLLFAVALALCACNTSSEPKDTLMNPAAEGFDLANSDPAAVELADSIMAAMGGWENWNSTRFISWNFFGNRNLIWDKKGERVRIESIKDSITYLVNLKTLNGKVWIKGQALTKSDSLDNMLKRGKSIWINDSYWLVMPFKLKDSGVTLKYLGEDTLKAGNKCNVLQLTFKNVGDTPQNKYHIYVDLTDNLVKEWAYYSDANQDSANFVRPWDNYKLYGNILLSADRSDESGPKNVKVEDTINEKIFTDLE